MWLVRSLYEKKQSFQWKFHLAGQFLRCGRYRINTASLNPKPPESYTDRLDFYNGGIATTVESGACFIFMDGFQARGSH